MLIIEGYFKRFGEAFESLKYWVWKKLPYDPSVLDSEFLAIPRTLSVGETEILFLLVSFYKSYSIIRDIDDLASDGLHGKNLDPSFPFNTLL
jgi:hypothetical protein